MAFWWKDALLGTAGHAGGSPILPAITACIVASVTGIALIRDGALLVSVSLALVFRIRVTPSYGLFAVRPAGSESTVSVLK